MWEHEPRVVFGKAAKWGEEPRGIPVAPKGCLTRRGATFMEPA